MIIRRPIPISVSIRDRILIAGIVLLLTAGNGIWLLMDTRPPAWDQSTHFLLGLDYLKALSSMNLWHILTVSNFYPPLYHLSLTPMIAITNSVDGAVLTNMLYFGIILFSLYAIGSVLFTRSVGLLSAVLFALFPFVQMMSRECLIDLSITAWICSSFYFLIRSRYFASSEHTIAFAISCALGMLTKWNFVFYLAVPYLLAIVKARVHNRRKGILALVLAIALSSPWYTVNIASIIQKGIRYITIGGAEGDPGLLTFSSLAWYPLALGEQIFQPIAALAIIVFILLCLKYQKGKWVPLLWIGVPVIIHTFMSNKDSRYTLPMLPAVALILSLWLLRDGQKRISRNIWIGAVLLMLGMQSLYASAGALLPFGSISFKLLKKSQHILLKRTYSRDDWHYEEIFKKMTELYPVHKKLARVAVVSNHPYMHSSSLRTYTRINRLPFVMYGYKRRLGEFSHFVLYKTGDKGPGFTLGNINQGAELIEDKGSSFHRRYTRAASIPLPDGSEAHLYRLNVQPQQIPAFTELALEMEEISYRDFNALHARLHLKGDSTDGVSRGKLSRVHISSDRLAYRSLDINNLALNMDRVHIDLAALMENHELFFFDVDRIELSALVKADVLRSYILHKARGISDCSVIMNNDTITITAKAYGVPLSCVIAVHIDKMENLLKTRVSSVRIWFIPVPTFLYAALTNRSFSLEAGEELPFKLDLKQIVITEGSVIIQ